MSNRISDQSSYNFAAAFYQGLAYGRSVKTAFDLGCLQIAMANLEIADEQVVPQLIALRGDAAQIVFAMANTTQSASPQPDTSQYNPTVKHSQRASGSNASPVNHEAVETQKGLQALLALHQRNLLKLQQKKAIYAAGEEPLSLLNQIEHQEGEIAQIKTKLGVSE